MAAAHSIGGGTLFDIGVRRRVWKNLAVGIAYSTMKNRNDATVSVRVPHPVIFGQSRTATATASDLEHSENAVHLQFMWMIPLTDKFELAVMVGPSFFTVRQTRRHRAGASGHHAIRRLSTTVTITPSA